MRYSFLENNKKNSEIKTSVPKTEIFRVLFHIWIFISSKRKKQLKIHFIIMVFSGFAEIITLSAMYPFIIAISNPSKLETLRITKKFSEINIFTDNPISFFIIIFIISILITSLLRLLNLWLIYRMSAVIGSELSTKSFRLILSQPYSFHLNTNSSEIIAVISTKIQVTVFALQRFFQFITGIIITFSVLVGLLILDPLSSITAASFFGLLYFIFSLKTKNRLTKNSQRVSSKRNIQFKSLQEGLGGIKDILMSGYEDVYTNIYRNADYPMRISETNSQFMASSPRIFIEAAALIFISLLALFLNKSRGINDGDALPILAVFALGAQRLLPSLQSSYNSWASIRGNISEVQDVLKFLKLKDNKKESNLKNKLNFEKKIVLKNVCFRYRENANWILKNIDLTINKGERIGIIGKSGSGKSTLLEILMGLLVPSKGELYVDNKKINNDIPLQLSWRMAISYVPQSIYLSDNSILGNIAFGEDPENIDFKFLKECTVIAQLYTFIESLPDGFQTFVGERGVKLSGGQRQRIGIARALYKKKQIIAFDESTSALDSATEDKLIKSIQNFDNNITVIIIAHRLSTLSFCNRIVKIENKTIFDSN